MIAAEGLGVRYGRAVALEGVSLDVGGGEVLAVLGANGAGKSSLIRALCGLVPHAGRVTLEGRDVAGRPFHRRPGLALVPEGRVLAPTLTVDETLRLGARGGPVRARRAALLDRFPELAARLTRLAGTLSGGEATLLSLARALMSGPRVLALDEPTLGLAPEAAARVLSTVAGLRDEGLAILLVEQDLAAALPLATRVLPLRHGRALREGPRDADALAALLLDRPEVPCSD